jgi:hypothetical protein
MGGGLCRHASPCGYRDAPLTGRLSVPQGPAKIRRAGTVTRRRAAARAGAHEGGGQPHVRGLGAVGGRVPLPLHGVPARRRRHTRRVALLRLLDPSPPPATDTHTHTHTHAAHLRRPSSMRRRPRQASTAAADNPLHPRARLHAPSRQLVYGRPLATATVYAPLSSAAAAHPAAQPSPNPALQSIISSPCSRHSHSPPAAGPATPLLQPHAHSLQPLRSPKAHGSRRLAALPYLTTYTGRALTFTGRAGPAAGGGPGGT